MPRRNDPAEHAQIHFLILMHRHVAKAHHALQRRRQPLINHSLPFQKHECIGHALVHAQVTLGNDMHGHVYRGLAGSFNVQREGVKVGEIIEERCGCSLGLDAANAPLYGRCLVKQNVVRRRRYYL